MKRFLLTLGCALGAFLPTHASASTWEAWFQWAGANAARSGVRITFPNTCPPSQAAGYLIASRTIFLCPAAFSRGEAYVAEALAHEAVHAAQHCVAIGTGRSGFSSLSTLLAAHGHGTELLQRAQKAIATKGDVIRASSKGNAEMLLIEAEAYALEDHPTQAIQVMAAVCK